MRTLGLAIALGLCAMVGGTAAHPPPQRTAAEAMDVLMWNREPVGGPFSLLDHKGKRRTDADFRGKLMLVYFGFSFCPDVCPGDLLQIGRAMEQLAQAGDAIQPLFITVDPERDTPKHLAAYVPSFHPRLIGLSGNARAVRQAANAYKVYYQKVMAGGAAGYTIDHSAFIYLMDRDGGYLGFFPPGTTAERMLDIIRPHLQAVQAR